MENLHKSVMIKEIISFLPLTKSVNVIDATFGGGGYSKTILEKFNVNQLLAIDRDPISKIFSILLEHVERAVNRQPDFRPKNS